MNADDMLMAAHVPVQHKTLYSESMGQFKPAPYGPLDTRLVSFTHFIYCSKFQSDANLLRVSLAQQPTNVQLVEKICKIVWAISDTSILNCQCSTSDTSN